MTQTEHRDRSSRIADGQADLVEIRAMAVLMHGACVLPNPRVINESLTVMRDAHRALAKGTATSPVSGKGAFEHRAAVDASRPPADGLVPYRTPGDAVRRRHHSDFARSQRLAGRVLVPLDIASAQRHPGDADSPPGDAGTLGSLDVVHARRLVEVLQQGARR